MRLRSANLCLVCLAAVLLLLAPGVSHAKSDGASSQLAFGVDMARRGLWKEALFRFQQAEKLEPENPRIQSDLGVAAEAAGQFDKALEYYQKALRLAPNDKGIRTNYTRFVEFYQGFKGKKEAKKGSLTMPEPSATPPPAPPGGKPAATPEPTVPPITPASPPAPGPKPSAPEDTPPPPADNRPSR